MRQIVINYMDQVQYLMGLIADTTELQKRFDRASAYIAKKTQYKHLLVQYKGGGYDGCWWQWNYFYFDSNGKFHNLVSSGRNGITSESEARTMLLKEEADYTYNLIRDINDFISETNEQHVVTIGASINEIENGRIIQIPCPCCGNLIAPYKEEYYPSMFPVGYKGNGGVGIQFTDYICEDCYMMGSCAYCGEYNDPEYNPLDEQGYCEYCKEENKDKK